MPVEADFKIAQKIADAVAALGSRDALAMSAVRTYWGAYPGAPLHRKERLTKLGIPRATFYRALSRAERYVERQVEAT